MFKIIKAVILAAALACAPAFADSFSQKDLIEKAADQTIKTYRAGGMAAIDAERQSCYPGLDLSARNKNRERDAQVCIAKDSAALKLYALLPESEQTSKQYENIDGFFMVWIQVTDAVVRITPEQYGYYLKPLMTGTASAVAARFKP